MPLTKDVAPYWEVPLKPELMDRLATMDVCYVAATGSIQMTYQDRELLRRLVDAGVMLWIDDGGGLRFPKLGDGFFFPIDFGAATFICFALADPIARVLGKTGIRVMTRIMGLMLAALAVEVMAVGLLKLFPGLGR